MLSENIISERLIIRDMVLDDAKEVWAIWGNSENEKYMSDPVGSLEEVEDICKKNENRNEKRDGYLRVATLKDTGKVIATCCFGPENNKDELGFGYSINQQYWGKGYATEIVKAIIKFGCGLGFKDFTSECAIENGASGRVMEKCGMHIDHTSSFKQPEKNIVYESHVYTLHID